MARMDRLSATVTSRHPAFFRHLIILLLSFVIGILISVSSQAQESFHKNNTQHYKAKFKKQIRTHIKACHILEKKRNQKPKVVSRFAIHRKPAGKAEGKTVEPVIPTRNENPSEKLAKVHRQEDREQKENDFPIPSSIQQEIIREMVAQDLRNRKDNEPIELAPLFFDLDEDKFSAADMNPFLIAVEFALQGRTILIKGHTNGQAENISNARLSAETIQKIRQLMHDMGVPDERISVMNYEEVAHHDNKTNRVQQMNLRVDFKAL